MYNRRNRCKHFNGLSSYACRADECYDKHDPRQCVGEEPSTCPKYEIFTEEELKAREERRKKMIENSILVRTEVVKALNGKYGSGQMPCPICKTGDLFYDYFNMKGRGHVFADCSNKCVFYME